MYLVLILEGDYDGQVNTPHFVTEDGEAAEAWVSRFNDLIQGYQEWVLNHPRYTEPNDEFKPFFHDWVMYYSPYAYVEKVEKR